MGGQILDYEAKRIRDEERAKERVNTERERQRADEAESRADEERANTERERQRADEAESRVKQAEARYRELEAEIVRLKGRANQ